VSHKTLAAAAQGGVKAAAAAPRYSGVRARRGAAAVRGWAVKAAAAAPNCGAQGPSRAAAHCSSHEAHHPKLPFEPEKILNLHSSAPAAGEATSTTGEVACVRGSLKK